MKLLAVLGMWLIVAAGALAQGLARNIPDDAPRGYLTHIAENVVSLDGKRIKLAPGAQIHGANNLLILPTTLPKESLVKYQLDPDGNLLRAWVLTREEAAKPDKYSTWRWPWSTSTDPGRPLNQVLPEPTQAPQPRPTK